MARFNVGEAFLQVVASFDNVHKTIAAEVAKIKDIQIDVTPNLDGFRERIAAEVAGIQGIDIPVTPDLTGFREKVQAATTGFDDINVHVNADVDDAAARAEMAALNAEADRLDGREVNINADVRNGDQARLLLTGIAAAAAAIAPALGPAVTLLGTIPAVVSGAAAPIAALVAGFQGVGDAVTAMSAAQAAATGTAAEQAAANEKLAEAMAKISPAAQSFVQVFQGQMVPALRAVKFEIQEGLFPGLEQALRNIQPLIPTIAAGLADTAKTLGDLAAQGAALMASGPWRADFAQILESNNRALASFGQAGLSLLDVFRNLAAAAGPLIEQFASWAQQASATFATFIEGQRASGELGQAFQQAGQFMSQLTTVLGQVATGIMQIAQAVAPLGSGFLSAVGAIAQFLGQVSQVSPLLAQITVAAVGLAPVLSRLGGAWTFLQSLPSQLASAASSFGGFVTGVTGSAAAGERARTAFTAMGQALPILGAAFVAADAIQNTFAANEEQVAAAILKGGQAAEQARTQLESHSTIAKLLTGEIVGLGTSWESASQKAEQMRAAMDPLARAQSDAARAQNDYLTAIQRFGPESEQAISAQQRFQQATQQVKTQQDQLKTALQGTTAALQEQAAALGNTLSAHINFLNKVEGVNQALKDNGASLDLATQKGRDNAAAINDMVQAALTWEQDAKKSGASTEELATIHDQLSAAIQKAAGQFGTLPPEVKKVVDAFVNAKPNVDLKPTVDASGVQKGAQDANTAIDGIHKPQPIQFAADVAQALSQIGLLTPAVNAVPKNPPQTQVTFGADVAQALAQIGLLTPKINEVPKAPPPTVMTADVLQALAQVGLVTPAIETVTGVEHKANITADVSGVQQGVTQANTSLGTVADKSVNITATSTGVTDAVTASTTALNGLVDKQITITANDQASSVVTAAIGLINGMPNHESTISVNNRASSVLQQIANQINSLQNRTITITTVYQTVGAPPGQAAGAILPMAPGGSLTPMSGRNARIVPPNSMRIIGDRMRGDEAFIPINNSSRSMAILGQTAGRMGFALVPMMGRGGFSSRDRHAWHWLEELLRRWRGGRGGGGGPSQAMLEMPLMGSGIHNVINTAAFSGGTASITRLKQGAYDVATTQMVPVPAIPTPPSTGGGGHGGRGGGRDVPNIYINTGNAGLDRWLAEIISRYVRVQGRGNVQRAFGS